MSASQVAIWGIAALATSGVIIRPWQLPEAVWAALGAIALVALGLLSPGDALAGVGKGTDVYLFLTGMMLLAKLARREGLFDWLAAVSVRHARGSPYRLFTLVYLVGVLVTVFLSNDATAVVLTPAVYAAARAAQAEPLPYLVACAFIANAASFVLPISNPANLVIFAGHMPPLPAWLAQFALPSLLAIIATYLMLRFTQREALRHETLAIVRDIPRLGFGGRATALGIAATALVLLAASAYDRQLGLPTFLAGGLTTLAILAVKREAPWTLLRGVSWSVLPLVAGLFVLVEGLDRTGLIAALTGLLQEALRTSLAGTAWVTGLVLAVACNLMNNLPAGLIAASMLSAAQPPPQIAGAVLIGVDLGPNLSVAGSLATILWLLALRREGEPFSALRFLRIGLWVMPPALLLALGALLLTAG